ncbi:Lipase/vitellogenin [Trinorchestia longiramus]|nr:Lipase/vitellogenin [Trinorchestia longiramus]
MIQKVVTLQAHTSAYVDTEEKMVFLTPLLSQGRVGGVVFVDYYHLTTINRPTMNANIDKVAETLARFLDHLATERNFRLSRVHVLCFSMGGRVLGTVNSHMNTKEKIGRITAMDPSTPWPGYHNRQAASQLLDDADATEVVVLRTSVVSHQLGSMARDFVFNGGVIQTGCYAWYLPQFSKYSHSVRS